MDVLYAICYTATRLRLMNSLINPIIYFVRLRQFRVAFIELLFQKSFSEAEEFEKKLFGSPNAVANLERNQGGVGEKQNPIQMNTNNEAETNHGGEGEEHIKDNQ